MEHPESLRLELNLANALRKQAKFAQAEPVILHVIETRIKNSGAEDVTTLHAQTRLAELYLDTRRFADAARLAGQVWEIRRRRSGEADPLTVDSLVQRVRAATGLREFSAARDLAAQALELRRKRNGNESAPALEMMELLAENAGQSGQLQEAVQWWEQCLAARERTLGASHGSTVQTMLQLAGALSRLGAAERAAELTGRARSLAAGRSSSGQPR
ncbi:MAG: tetratricopeptide repeat protein [Acidobacteria bacterium]|nr:tetratricopeptide repeat protein [Acidobacteriota bacterium]